MAQQCGAPLGDAVKDFLRLRKLRSCSVLRAFPAAPVVVTRNALPSLRPEKIRNLRKHMISRAKILHGVARWGFRAFFVASFTQGSALLRPWAIEWRPLGAFRTCAKLACRRAEWALGPERAQTLQPRAKASVALGNQGRTDMPKAL